MLDELVVLKIGFWTFEDPQDGCGRSRVPHGGMLWPVHRSLSKEGWVAQHYLERRGRSLDVDATCRRRLDPRTLG
jgi:hypothetical protein